MAVSPSERETEWDFPGSKYAFQLLRSGHRGCSSPYFTLPARMKKNLFLSNSETFLILNEKSNMLAVKV